MSDEPNHLEQRCSELAEELRLVTRDRNAIRSQLDAMRQPGAYAIDAEIGAQHLKLVEQFQQLRVQTFVDVVESFAEESGLVPSNPDLIHKVVGELSEAIFSTLDQCLRTGQLGSAKLSQELVTRCWNLLSRRFPTDRGGKEASALSKQLAGLIEASIAVYRGMSQAIPPAFPFWPEPGVALDLESHDVLPGCPTTKNSRVHHVVFPGYRITGDQPRLVDRATVMSGHGEPMRGTSAQPGEPLRLAERDGRGERLLRWSRQNTKAITVLCLVVVIPVSAALVFAARARSSALSDLAVAQREKAEAQQQRAAAERNEKIATAAAIQQKDVAAALRRKAEQEEIEARQQANLVQESEAEAKKQFEVAVEEREQVEQQLEIALEQKRQAEQQLKIAAEERQQAEQQLEIAFKRAEFEAYAALIGLAAAKIDEKEFADARELLNRPLCKSRGWEWGRLMHLCDQTAAALESKTLVEAAAPSLDGSPFVLGGLVLQGHNAPVLSAAFSPNGEHVLTVAQDRTAKIWRAASGEELLSLRETREFPAKAVIFATGTRLVTNGPDNTSHVWDVETGVSSVVLHRTGRSAAVAAAKGGKWLLTGGDQQTAKLWDAESGALLSELAGHNSDVTAVAFSDGEDLLYTGDRSGQGLLWDRKTGNQIQPLTWHTDKIVGATFLPQENEVQASVPQASVPQASVLLTAGDKRVTRWVQSADSGELVVDKSWSLRHPDPIVSLQLSGDRRFALTAAQDGMVRLWNIEHKKVVAKVRVEEGNVDLAAISLDGRGALTVHRRDQIVRHWSLNTSTSSEPDTEPINGQLLSATNVGSVWSAVFLPNGRDFLTVGDDGAKLWASFPDSEERSVRTTFRPPVAIARSSFSPNGNRVVTPSANDANIWDAKSGVQLKSVGDHQQCVNSAIFSPNGKYVLTASNDGTASVWNASGGAPVREYKGHTGAVYSADFSTDSKRIVTASADNTARIWASAEAKTLATLTDHEGSVLSAVFSENGQQVVTGSQDCTARIWDAETGKLLFVLSGHTASVTSVCFTPDSRRVFTGSADLTAKLWDASTGYELLTLKGHTQEVTSVAFSRDGRSVVTGSRDGTAIVWRSTDSN